MNDTGRVRRPMPEVPKPGKAGGIGQVYCGFVTKYLEKYLGVQQAQAAEPPRRAAGGGRLAMGDVQQQDTTKRAQDSTKRAQDSTKRAQDSTKRAQDSTKRAQDTTKRAQDTTKRAQDTTKRAQDTTHPPAVNPAPITPAPGAAPAVTPTPVPASPANVVPSNVPPNVPPPVAGANPKPTLSAAAPERVNTNPELQDAGLRIGEARQRAARFGIEIQKKFSLAAACIVFVLIGAPLAVRFPRGGVGLVIGVSFFVFAVYYVALTSGESLANRNFVTPFWAMWADNIIFLIVAIPLIMRMGTERVTGRGGGFAEKMDGVRLWFARVSASRRSSTDGGIAT
jgi:lipopolysaccharide export system permease protein